MRVENLFPVSKAFILGMWMHRPFCLKLHKIIPKLCTLVPFTEGRLAEHHMLVSALPYNTEEVGRTPS